MIEISHLENFLAVQWLGLRASIAGGRGSIPGQELRSPKPHGVGWGERKKKEISHLKARDV